MGGVTVGIDFGTNYTKIARYKGDGQFELFKFPGPSGTEYIPTTVSYRQKGNEVLVSIGASALIDFITYHQNTRLATRIKLFLPIRDANEQKAQGWTLDSHPDDVVKEYIAQLLLKHKYSLKSVWGTIENAVISVPEVWQRTAYNPGAEALRRILIDELGLSVDHLRSEPVCAAAYYAWTYQRYEKRDKGTESPFNLLVCDMGGGTFDVALCQVKGKSVNVLDFDGNSEGGWGLAGVRFDEELVRRVFKRVNRREPEPYELLDWITKFEEIKRLRNNEIEEEFSQIEQRGILDDPKILEELNDTPIDTYTFGPSLTPTIGEILESYRPIEDGIKQVLDRVKERLRQREMKIDRVAIVGGFGQFPLVRRTILKTLGIKTSHRNPQFDPILHKNFGLHFAIAYGAALIAAREIEPFEYYPHSLLLKCWVREKQGLKEVYEHVVKAGQLLSGSNQPAFSESIFYVQRQAYQPLPVCIQLEGKGEPIPIQLPHANYPEPGQYKVSVSIDRSNLAILTFENVETKKRYEYRLGNLDPIIFAQKGGKNS